MKVSLIAAISNNRVLGHKGGIPWKSDADMQHFKNTTTGKPVIMGYNTWISLNRSKGLPNRLNVVITDRHFDELTPQINEAQLQAHIIVARNLNEAILACEKLTETWGNDAWIIGGAQLYEQSLRNSIVDEVVLTRFPELEVEGDTFLIEFENLMDHDGRLIYELTSEPQINKDVDPKMQIEIYTRANK